MRNKEAGMKETIEGRNKRMEENFLRGGEGMNKQTWEGRERRKCCSSAKQREPAGALNLPPIRGLMTV